MRTAAAATCPYSPAQVRNLAAHVRYDGAQRWYYHKGVGPREVVLFTHYTKARFFANVHCAVRQQPSGELPPGMATRKSVENRLRLYFLPEEEEL